jgi:2,3,4,5-tetrahydropyridine-2,6-dicarboxylate N-succinyltransferase
MEHLQKIIENGYAQRDQWKANGAPAELQQAILQTIHLLDGGQLRIAEKKNGEWQVNQWAKQAVLLSFKTHENRIIDAGFTHFYDKVPLKFAEFNQDDFVKAGIRVVPPACVRKGAFIAANTVLMPSYVNIGAYIDSGTMIDTWASIGSCAQIGKNVHISAGTGIGGVLEPVQANPTIIEDDCFIGARSEIVEGVVVEQGSVISMGVFITQSTPIYCRDTKKIIYGRVPAGSVVVPGTLPSADGSYGRPCVIIIKQVDAKTRQKTSLNELLRMD